MTDFLGALLAVSLFLLFAAWTVFFPTVGLLFVLGLI